MHELLAELVRADEAHSATLEELDELLAGAMSIREQADALAAVLAAGPAERQRLLEALGAARQDLEARADALAAAEAELAAAEGRRDQARLAAARRLHVRAADDLAAARRRTAGCATALEEHDRRLAGAEREAPEVEARAAALTRALRDRPRLALEASRDPSPGLAGVAEWASVARAALLVARSGVAAEREAVIRQANELASVLLGEPQGASSAAAVARRVEQAQRA